MASNSGPCSHQILFFDACVIAVFASILLVFSNALLGGAFLFTALSAYWAARVARLPHAALKSVLVFTAVISLCAAGTFGIFIYTAVKEQTMQREEQMFIPLIELAGCTVFGFVAVLNALSVCCLSHREHDDSAAEPRLPKPRRGAIGKVVKAE